MKRVPNPGNGAKWNRVHRGPKGLISVAESLEEHLVNAYPSLLGELERLKTVPVPASFHIPPGKVTSIRLIELGVPGICPRCGAYDANPNPECRNPECREHSTRPERR